MEKDIAQITGLWEELIDFHKARDAFFSRSREGSKRFGEFIAGNLRKDDAIVYVAENNGSVIAYILATAQEYPPVYEIKNYGVINDLAVASAYRRTGIGRQLVAMAMEWFLGKQIRRIELEVVEANEVSTSFWRKMGCTPYKQVCYMEI